MSTEEITDEVDETPEAGKWRRSLAYDEQILAAPGKRCGLVWDPWMGDWFTSYSPRNGNSNAEGYWDHWVDLALMILRDELTGIVRPSVYETALECLPEPLDLYDGANRSLTDGELMKRFRRDPS